MSTAMRTSLTERPSPSRPRTSAASSGRSVFDRIFSILRAPDEVSVQRCAIVSTSCGS